MTEEQKTKYARTLEKLTEEQRKEFIHVVGIINQSTPEKRFTIKGQTYISLLWDDPNTGKMRMIVSFKGWTINTVDRPIKECLPGK